MQNFSGVTGPWRAVECLPAPGSHVWGVDETMMFSLQCCHQDLVTRTHTDRAPVLWGLPETVFNAVSLNRRGPCFFELQPFTCYHSDCTDRPLCAAAHTRGLKLQTTSCKPSCFNESRDSICRKGEKPTFHFLYSFVLLSKIHLISYF